MNHRGAGTRVKIRRTSSDFLPNRLNDLRFCAFSVAWPSVCARTGLGTAAPSCDARGRVLAGTGVTTPNSPPSDDGSVSLNSSGMAASAPVPGTLLVAFSRPGPVPRRGRVTWSCPPSDEFDVEASEIDASRASAGAPHEVVVGVGNDDSAPSDDTVRVGESAGSVPVAVMRLWMLGACAGRRAVPEPEPEPESDRRLRCASDDDVLVSESEGAAVAWEGALPGWVMTMGGGFSRRDRTVSDFGEGDGGASNDPRGDAESTGS